MHIAMHDFFAYSFELLISLRIIQQQVYPKKIIDNVFCFCYQVISQLETSCLQEVWVDSTTDGHNVVHIKFDYINPDRQTRDYIMESQEDSRVKIRLAFISW